MALAKVGFFLGLLAATALLIAMPFFAPLTFSFAAGRLDLMHQLLVDYRLAHSLEDQLIFTPNEGDDRPPMTCDGATGTDEYRCLLHTRLREAAVANPSILYPGFAAHQPVYLRVVDARLGFGGLTLEAINELLWALLLGWGSLRMRQPPIAARPWAQPWPSTVLAFVAMVAAASIISWFDTDPTGNFAFVSMHPATSEIALTLLGVGVATPLLEEAIMRGVAWNAVRSRLGPISSSLLISSGFALLHGYAAIGTLGTFVVSLFLCALRHYTGRLRYSVAAHAGMNMVVVWGALIDST